MDLFCRGSEEVRHPSQNADSAYPFCIACDGKKGTLSQHFVTHVVPPLAADTARWSAMSITRITFLPQPTIHYAANLPWQPNYDRNDENSAFQQNGSMMGAGLKTLFSLSFWVKGLAM